jgi:hypothetical protein
MPWTSEASARKTKKASTPAKKVAWAGAANSVLARTGDEGQAIRVANSVVKKATKAVGKGSPGKARRPKKERFAAEDS